MKRVGSNPAVTTQIKNGLNTVLNTAGLHIGTTRADRDEQARLEKLAAKGHWDQAPFAEGLMLDTQKHLAFLKTVCGPYRAELSAMPNSEAQGFFRNNGWFESVDADVLYGVIRHFAPALVVEIGSGYSSRLTAQAIRDGRLPTRLVCVDPSPRVEIKRCADECIESPVEDLPVDELPARLKAGDVLFIDSSHLVKSGGDVVYLYLQVLPRLRPGVLIHAHDIFLPFEYPKEFILENRWEWSEQYLLYALLTGNRAYEILWPSCYMWQTQQDRVRVTMPVDKLAPAPSSLWVRKVSQ